jgi:hypothetical protein
MARFGNSPMGRCRSSLLNFFAENGKNINCIFTSAIKYAIIEFIKMPKTSKILSEVAVWRLKEMYTLIG